MLFFSTAHGAPPGAASARGPSCVYPDVGGLDPIPFAQGASAPAGTGGDIPGGRWELIAVLYDSFLTVTGEAVGALELESTGASSGQGSAALMVDITSPTAEMVDETGAGPYSASGSVLNFQNDCGEQLLLGDAEFDIDDSGTMPTMTLWGSIDITDPFPTSIPIEARFELVEPDGTGDPIFGDRFETP